MPVWPEWPIISSLIVSPACCMCLAMGRFHALSRPSAPPPFLCRPPLLHWITFLGSANWSHMSGIPQTKGFYFLLHKDPHCTQPAQILGRVKEKWRGSLKPCLVSKGKLNHAGICRVGFTVYELKYSGILREMNRLPVAGGVFHLTLNLCPALTLHFWQS